MDHLDQSAYREWQSQQDESELDEIAESHPNVYRECARAMMRLMHNAIATSMESKASAWGVMFATAHPLCIGKSMSDVATKLKVSRATISEIATKFCQDNRIPPSLYMKSEQARETAKRVRNSKIQ